MVSRHDIESIMLLISFISLCECIAVELDWNLVNGDYFHIEGEIEELNFL